MIQTLQFAAFVVGAVNPPVARSIPSDVPMVGEFKPSTSAALSHNDKVR